VFDATNPLDGQDGWLPERGYGKGQIFTLPGGNIRR
jgi:hypothetical protein